MDKKLKEILDIVRKPEKMTKEEAAQVFSYYKETQNEELLEALTIANEGLVKHSLKKYSERSDYDDILQEGRIGLVTAIKRFNPDYGYAFSTYATRYITGYVGRYDDSYNPIYSPVYINTAFKKMCRLQTDFPNDTDEELSKKMGLSLEKYKELEKQYYNAQVLSLDVKVSDEEDGATLLDFIPAKSNELYFIEQNETKEIVVDTLESITNSERNFDILKKSFGIGCEPVPSRKIAEEYGVSFQAINQIVNRHIWKLRHPHMKMKLKERLGVPDSMRDADIVSYLRNAQ